MKSKTILTVAAAIALAASPAVGLAQRAGFQAGIAQPQMPPAGNRGVAPSPPAGTNPHGTFRRVPELVGPGFHHHFPPLAPLIPLVPTFPTVIVPNTVLVPGQTILPPGPVSPSSNIFFPANPIQPSPPFSPFSSLPPLGPPVLGMSRDQVIRQFGAPSVSVITSTGETMYFPGGGTVIIQNGQVVGTK